MTWSESITGFARFLRFEKAFSKNTISSYSNDVKKLAAYLQENRPELGPEDVSVEDLRAYLAECGAETMNTRSQIRWMSAVKSFFKYLKEEGLCQMNPIEDMDYPRIGPHIPDVLSVMEMESILSSVDLSGEFGPRNRTIMEILYGSGLRVSELVNLRLSDIFWDEQMLRIVGKGNKQRFVPMGEMSIKYLKDYLEHDRRRMSPVKGSEDIVFLNRRGRHLTREMVFLIIRKQADKAGIHKTISPHTFRHSFATHMVQAGADLRSVQAMLGHESIVTTEIYTHLDKDYLRQMLVDFHPLSKKSKFED